MSEQTFSDVMGGITGQGDHWKAAVPTHWRQGRTAFGGIIAALSLEAARRAFQEMPLLRSAQISFIGPVPGEADFQCTLLRQGRSATFVQVSVTAEGTPAAQAVFCFGASRLSALHDPAPAPETVPPPEETEPLFPSSELGPAFIKNFDTGFAAGFRPVSAVPHASNHLWLRHRDVRAQSSETGFLALADAPPPAAMAMMREPGPISTVSWLMTLFDHDFVSRDGWWLIRSVADQVSDGYSSQSMAIWNRDGRPMALARQAIAVFG